MEIKTQVFICIPGTWSTRSDMVRAIASKSNGLLFVGQVLMDTTTKEKYELAVYGHDPDLAKAFEIAGRPRITQADIQAIRSHTFTLYMTAEGGSLKKAQGVLNVSGGLLQAGGLAIKVDTTGKAHTSVDWLALASANNEMALFYAFVTLVGSGGRYYSCGMHNLGYRDAIVEGKIPPDAAARLLQTFLLYVWVEKPVILDGQLFSETQDSQHYRLLGVTCTTYPSDHPYSNPFGMWQLEAIQH
jgi:hypothetical protein